MSSTDDVGDSVAQALKAMTALRDCDVICLPENALYLRLTSERGAHPTTFDLTEPFWSQFRDFAKVQGTHILIGSIPYKREKGLPTNTTIWVNHEGDIRPAYDKIHLFDVDVDGAPPVRESESFAHGGAPQIIEINGWRIGLSICYDVRFAELYSWYAAREVDVLMVPSAFLVPTGEAHWHALLRARAIESQAFVVAAAQSGGHHNARGNRRETFGHSLVVDPWGVVLADIDTPGAAEVAVELEPSRLFQVRKQIPQKSHRRRF